MLTLNSLRINNFRAISDAFLEFKDNSVILITGDNGQCKSTIMQAIALNMLDHAKENLEDYVKTGEKNFTIELKFTDDNKVYESIINYDIVKKATKRVLRVTDGETTEHYNSDATKLLKSMYDPKTILASRFIFEGEIDIVNARAAERRDNLKKIYDLDFKEELKIVQNEIDTITKERMVVSNKLAELNGIKSTLNNNSTKLYDQELSKEEYISLQKEIDHLNKDKTVYESDLVKIEDLTKFTKDQVNKIETNRSQILSNEKTVEDIKQSKINQLKQSINNFDEHKGVEEVINNTQKTLDSIQNQIDVKQKELDNLDRPKRVPINVDESNKDQYSKEQLNLTTDIREIEHKQTLIEQKKCPECGTDLLSDSNYNPKQLSIELIQKTRRLNEVSKKLKDIDIIAETIREVKESNQNLGIKQTKISNEIDSLKQRLDNEQKSKDVKVTQVIQLNLMTNDSNKDQVKIYENQVKNMEQSIKMWNQEIDKVSREVRERVSKEINVTIYSNTGKKLISNNPDTKQINSKDLIKPSSKSNLERGKMIINRPESYQNDNKNIKSIVIECRTGQECLIEGQDGCQASSLQDGCLTGLSGNDGCLELESNNPGMIGVQGCVGLNGLTCNQTVEDVSRETSCQEVVKDNMFKEKKDQIYRGLEGILLDIESLTVKNIIDKLSYLFTLYRDMMNEIDNEINACLPPVKTYLENEMRNVEIEKISKYNKDKEIEVISEIEKNLEILEDYNNTYETLVKSKEIMYKDFPVYVIDKLLRVVESAMNEFISMCYGRYDIKIVEKGDSLFILYGSGDSYKDIKNASGYERSLYNIAWKYAISKSSNSMSGLSYMFMDEADSMASDDNAVKLYKDVLCRSVGLIYNQMFIITHKREVIDSLLLDGEIGKNVYVYECNNGEIERV